MNRTDCIMFNRRQDRDSPLSGPSGVDGPVSNNHGCLGAMKYSHDSYSGRQHTCPLRKGQVGGRLASNGCVVFHLHPKCSLHLLRLMHCQIGPPISRGILVCPSFLPNCPEHCVHRIVRYLLLRFVFFSLCTTSIKIHQQPQGPQ